MEQWEKNLDIKLTEYLDSKYSDNTKNYIRSIISYLNKKGDNGFPILIKAKELQNALVPNIIPHVSLYYRLLKELGEEDGIGIIKRVVGEREPRKKGKNPIFYKLAILYKLPSYEEIAIGKSRWEVSCFVVAGRLSVAYELLAEFSGLLNISMKLLAENNLLDHFSHLSEVNESLATYNVFKNEALLSPDNLVNKRWNELVSWDITPFAFSDRQLKHRHNNDGTLSNIERIPWEYGLSRLYPLDKITFIPPFLYPEHYRTGEENKLKVYPPYGDDY